jgi:hypothetical protein
MEADFIAPGGGDQRMAAAVEGEEVRFAPDSSLEGDEFEPSVPRKRDLLFKSAHQWQRGAPRAL